MVQLKSWVKKTESLVYFKACTNYGGQAVSCLGLTVVMVSIIFHFQGVSLVVHHVKAWIPACSAGMATTLSLLIVENAKVESLDPHQVSLMCLYRPCYTGSTLSMRIYDMLEYH